jgi:twitching motility protein PilT
MIEKQGSVLLTFLLKRCLELHASDVHLSTGLAPIFRIHGSLNPDNSEHLGSNEIISIVTLLLSDTKQDELQKTGHVDLAYSLPNKERFRINVYLEMNKTAIAIRHLDNCFKSMQQLHLPPQLENITNFKHGLILVCGSTGSGKSTTLASMLHEINNTRKCHILTIEDPIEFVHENINSMIHQRELGSDVISFASSLRASLRQDPDVIMVGEMRDLETMKAALTAAETGHLVFSTLHTGDAVGVVERLIGSFPGDEQVVARTRIASALKSVIAQRLIPVEDGNGRVPATEILMVTNSVSNLIASGKTSQIYSSMESGKAEGMQTLEQSLHSMVKDRWISNKTALEYSKNNTALEKLLNKNNGLRLGEKHGY